MPIQTTLIKLTVNCAKHGDKFHDVHNGADGKPEKCTACEFLIHYNQQVRKMEREIESLNNALEGFMRTQSVVAVTVGSKFLTGTI